MAEMGLKIEFLGGSSICFRVSVPRSNIISLLKPKFLPPGCWEKIPLNYCIPVAALKPSGCCQFVFNITKFFLQLQKIPDWPSGQDKLLPALLSRQGQRRVVAPLQFLPSIVVAAIAAVLASVTFSSNFSCEA